MFGRCWVRILPEYQLSWLRFFMGSFSPSRQWWVNTFIRHDCDLPNPFSSLVITQCCMRLHSVTSENTLIDSSHFYSFVYSLKFSSDWDLLFLRDSWVWATPPFQLRTETFCFWNIFYLQYWMMDKVLKCSDPTDCCKIIACWETGSSQFCVWHTSYSYAWPLVNLR
jgi:hypothetical protein